ncbi:MAG: hypothetical protein M1337_05405 [Actinobacteria bacterium]|nr:hypothetical protein [Actinomycetota bacterium]
MRLGIVGGRLQRTEAVYLAKAAGYVPVLVDRHPATPASGLAAESHVFDVVADLARARAVLASCDAVLPACEDLETLRCLDARLRVWGVPLLFHLPSYEMSRSKARSDRLIAVLDVPRPLPWPECGFPAVVKPSESSGSEAVTVVGSESELRKAVATLERDGHVPVVQELVAGPSLSLEGRSSLPHTMPRLWTPSAGRCGQTGRRTMHGTVWSRLSRRTLTSRGHTFIWRSCWRELERLGLPRRNCSAPSTCSPTVTTPQRQQPYCAPSVCPSCA